MKRSRGVWIVLILLVFILLLTREYSTANLLAASSTPTRTPVARSAQDTTFTIYLPIIFKPPAPIYLPLVMRAPSPTPTPTPTATPIPNPIQNWNFEAGHVAWWEEPPNGIITNDLQGKPAHSGIWAAWLGGEYDAVHYLSQYVNIPLGAQTLSFWYWIDSVEVCGYYDSAGLYVDGYRLVEFDLCRNNNTGGWVKRAINISTYAGRSVWIQFVAFLDQDTNSNFLVDDVVIGSGG